jgi:hypothetical protein
MKVGELVIVSARGQRVRCRVDAVSYDGRALALVALGTNIGLFVVDNAGVWRDLGGNRLEIEPFVPGTPGNN